MTRLRLITADAALRHALEEHVRAREEWVFEIVASWPSESDERAVTLVDAAFARDGKLPAVFPSPLLVLGEGGIPAEVVTESFPKPVRLGWLLGRLEFYRQVVEDQAGDRPVPLGPYLFAPRRRELVHPARAAVIKLTDKESGLLDYLRRAAQPVPREELLAAVWGYGGSVDTHTLETHLYRLRRALQPEGEGAEPFVVEKGCYGLHPAWR